MRTVAVGSSGLVPQGKMDLAAMKLLEAAPLGCEVILLGSYAKGIATVHSDEDFLVIEPSIQDRHAEMISLRDVHGDLGLPVDVLACESQVGHEIDGFHGQQAVEKSLKAILEMRGTAFPLTHDLMVLWDLLGHETENRPLLADDVRQLHSFAVRFRYEDFDPVETANTEADARRLVAIASAAVEWARG